MSVRRMGFAALAVTAVLGATRPGASAEPENWPAVKCARYTKAWDQALARMGRNGLGPAFLERHAAFLTSGCTARADVCARSEREIELANAMIVMAMNAGMASTFLPFYCRD